jgi:hypothetical protein
VLRFVAPATTILAPARKIKKSQIADVLAA